ncbi:hypothetical protein TrRE_jg5153, partial [Triparma retinervis]
MEKTRRSTLFKFRAAAHAVMSIHKEKNLAFFKLKEKWGLGTGKKDSFAGEVYDALRENRPGGEGGMGTRKKRDCREVFYEHNVVAGTELCVPCFDGLVVGFQGIRRVKEGRIRWERREERVREERVKFGGGGRGRGGWKDDGKDGGKEDEEDMMEGGLEDMMEGGLEDMIKDMTEKARLQMLRIPIPKEYRSLRCPLFITWEKEGVGLEDLFVRGKKGSMRPVKLEEGLIRMAREAAGEDNDLMYLPVRENEIRRLKCVIEIPDSFESLYNLGDWVPSVHGLGIRFVDSIGSKYSGSLMPSETSNLSITDDALARMLIVKAGYGGLITNGMIRKAVFMRFVTTKCEMTYE